MCTDSCIIWMEESIASEDVFDKHILEVGSYDVNGSVRPTVERLLPTEYIGVDIRPGPRVDLICRAEELAEVLGKNRFDMVICANTLEHIRDWRQAVSQMKRVCRPGGLIIIIVPARLSFHAYPNDFWRFQPHDLSKIFADFRLLKIEKDTAYPSFSYAKVKKPLNFVEKDLSDIAVYSMITNRQTKNVHFWHFLSLRYGWQVLDFAARTNISGWTRFKLFIVMGFKIRIVEPVKKLLKVD